MLWNAYNQWNIAVFYCRTSLHNKPVALNQPNDRVDHNSTVMCMVCITRRCVDHDQDHTPGDAKRGLWDNAGYEKPNAGYETTHTHIIVAKYTSTSHQIKLPCLNSNDHTGQLHRACVTSIAMARAGAVSDGGGHGDGNFDESGG